MNSRIRFIAGLALCVLFTSLSSCYKENNPWDGLVTNQGPVAIIRSVAAAPTTVTAGSASTITVVFTTLEKSVTKLNLYATVGSAARALVNATPVSDAPPKLDRQTKTLTYTVPATAAKGTRIIINVGVVTEGEQEVLTGNATITVQ